MNNIIILNNAEIQSNLDRVKFAEGLILQLPKEHDGRNTWLLNYGKSEEAIEARKKRVIEFNNITQSAKVIGNDNINYFCTTFDLQNKQENTNVINELIKNNHIISKQINDGYHTIEELYEFRKLYNALFVNSLSAAEVIKYNVHKSYKHNDGEDCFGGGWFIVVVELPTGTISNHYKNEDWELFKIPTTDKSTTPFDGHTSKNVQERILSYIKTTL